MRPMGGVEHLCHFACLGYNATDVVRQLQWMNSYIVKVVKASETWNLPSTIESSLYYFTLTANWVAEAQMRATLVLR